MAFLDESYLLGTPCAKRLFDAIAALPVIDPHNHVNVKEIADNAAYGDAWQLFAATDHYVWEVMRKAEVPESLITGSAASNHDKFMALAAALPRIAGNPVYEWIHLDLKRYFGIGEILSPATGETVWRAVNAKLATPAFRPQTLLTGVLNVETMSSTDDPADNLASHARANASFGRQLIRPTWRPDQAMKIAAPGWRGYVARLAASENAAVATLDDFMNVLRRRHDFFAGAGCRASDHGVEELIPASFDDRAAAAKIFAKVLGGSAPTAEERDLFMGWFLLEMVRLNVEKGWVTQLHAGAVRDVRDTLFSSLGPDAGGDVCDHKIGFIAGLRPILNAFDGSGKFVLYSLDPGHWPTLATAARAFGPTVRLGSAWWLCDHPVGMKRQLEWFGSVDLWSAFAGMVSDSRKILSYGSRFEMFRRVLADTVGDAVTRGRLPEEAAVEIVKVMAYSGPKRFWDL